MTDRPVIAVVDDDESVRKALDSLLRSWGMAVTSFASAAEFLQSPRLANTSCLIADVQMPGMGGLELHDRLTELGHRLPIILMTAYPDAKLRDRALAAGAIAFLGKPFAAQELFQYTEDALRLPRSS